MRENSMIVFVFFLAGLIIGSILSATTLYPYKENPQYIVVNENAYKNNFAEPKVEIDYETFLKHIETTKPKDIYINIERRCKFSFENPIEESFWLYIGSGSKRLHAASHDTVLTAMVAYNSVIDYNKSIEQVK